MQEGQKKFMDFILECVEEKEKEKAKAMLSDNFRLQVEGRFSQEDLQSFHREILKILKPERREEVKNVLDQFGHTHVNP